MEKLNIAQKKERKKKIWISGTIITGLLAILATYANANSTTDTTKHSKPLLSKIECTTVSSRDIYYSNKRHVSGDRPHLPGGPSRWIEICQFTLEDGTMCVTTGYKSTGESLQCFPKKEND